MKTTGIAGMGLIVLGLGMAVTTAFAARHLPEERGKALFENPRAFGGEKSCSSCHPGGKGLEQAGTKKKFNIMKQTQNSLAEAVNFCIINASRGKAIALDSAEMKDIKAYIKSLAAKPAAPGYGAPPSRPRGY